MYNVSKKLKEKNKDKAKEIRRKKSIKKKVIIYMFIKK